MIKKASLTRLGKKKISTGFTDGLVPDMWHISPQKHNSKPTKYLLPVNRKSLRDINFSEDQSSDSNANSI